MGGVAEEERAGPADDDTVESDASGASDEWLRAVAHVPSVAVADLVGKSVGRYRVDQVLGRGGMGIVYLAEDTHLSRVVALKVMSARSVGDDERRRRSVREARIAAKLNDPHVATVYDAGEIDERVYLAMEYVPGPSLREVLRERGRLPIEEVVRIGLAIARGLAHAHAAGVVHRDVKPENVIVGEGGTVKVLDFGVAKIAADAPRAEGDTTTLETREGRILGTPAYMAPEQAKGVAVDARSDVFSLGVTMFEMATGTRPWVGATPLDVLIAMDRDAPPALRRLRRDVPGWLDEVVRRCLRRAPDERFASAADVVRALTERRRSRPDLARWLAFVGLVGIAASTAFAVTRRPAPVLAPLPPASSSVATAPIAKAAVVDPPAPAASSAPAVEAPKPPAKPTSVPRARRRGPLDDPK